MIQLQNLFLSFGGQVVLNGITWTIKPKQRIGLIGPNGAGKSTLLRVLTGRQPLDGGTVMHGGMSVGYLAQDVQEMDTSRSVREEALHAFDDVLALQAEERQLTQAMADADNHEDDAYHQLLVQFDRVHTRLMAREAHMMVPRTEAVLTGLGFDPDDLDRPLSTFSGGWRMRVALAQILLRQPDALLLDEPTNHLDIDSIDWLEGYLRSYPGTVIIVSHDRYFLDRMVTTTAEIVRGQLTVYAGNYTFYLTERAERRILQQSAYDNQQKSIAETQRFIERFRYKASKARQVQSRVKMLEKLERIPEPPSDEAAISIRFPEPRRSGRVVLELSQFSKTYQGDEGTVEVFRKADPLAIERGDKIALIGRNGAGKSTLARMLGGTEPFDGTRTLGYQVEHAFFAQHQAETLNPRNTILEEMMAAAQGQTETQIRSLLGAFLFTGDDVFKPIAVLSGGEKSRVALARSLLVPANFLILDEPTNHLDIQSINVLIEALRQYTGSFVVVSHDRHFLDQVVNKVWRAEDGQVRAYLGNFSEYQYQVEHGTAQRLAAAPPPPSAEEAEAAQTASSSSGPKTKAQKRAEAEARQQRYTAAQGQPASGSQQGQQSKGKGQRGKGQKGKKGKDASGNGQQPAKRKKDYSRISAFKLRKLYAKAEAQILEKEERQTALEAALADPNLYKEPDRFNQYLREYDAVKDTLPRLYEDWEALAEALAQHEG